MQKNIISGSSVRCPAFYLLTIGVLVLFLNSCSGESDKLFQRIPSSESGLTFSNDLENTPEFNILNYLYFYDGGGVSIGDVNNDGLPDIYLTANMKPNKLYLNKGDFTFEDITEKAGVEGTADWATGTVFADVNGDGLLDIYVSSVNYLSKSGKNQLFINNGDLTFTDQAEKYGLDFEGFSKQATFFDYDNDGDLDMYLLNHAVHTRQTFTKAEKRKTYDPDAGDRLFRNDGDTFTDVTRESGIYSSLIGYGLASTAGDLNSDGCTDLYVSNDFHENDYLYLNNCDGTFDEVLQQSTGHTSRASMGVDIADFNNDGRPDIFVLDMLPGDESGRKSSVSSEPYNVYRVQREFGYHPQLIRNTLQLNLGTLKGETPYFSEISQLAGVSATDWSWASLFFDMDNDGRKDLFVSNGIYRRPNDLDYLVLLRSNSVQDVMQRGMSDTTMSLIQKMPHVKIPNVAFKNEGGLTFANANDQWGFEQPTYSNGAAYGDLDNDGDLDLVVNNVNSTASVYRNMTRERKGGNYLKVNLRGDKKNTYGIGAKVKVHTGERSQLYEMIPTRGFLSSVEPSILVGLDSLETIDSVAVSWPDGGHQTMENVEANQTLTVRQEEASMTSSPSNDSEGGKKGFSDITGTKEFVPGHRENTYVDFNRERLIPRMLSAEGPPLASADVNGDGLDDYYLGGARHQSGTLMIQDSPGSFRKSNESIFHRDRSFEDVDALFFDANGDGAPDLYVVSGGNEHSYRSDAYEDRLYLNDGKGSFVRLDNMLPPMRENGSVVAGADYDGDGDTDLFLGTRSIPRNYGFAPDSYLLQNDGKGNFTDVTDRVAPGLRGVGMVSDASWQDINGNGSPDLLLAGEWMPLTFFLNREGFLKDATQKAGLEHSSGWWNTLEAGDFDGDGDMDFIAGNLGLNTFLKATKDQPMVMYLKDFNNDGQLDPVIARTVNGKEYPVATRDEILRNFKSLRSLFPNYSDFAGKTVSQIFGDRLKDSIQVKKVYEMRSSLIENLGDGSFRLQPLPKRMQFAPILALTSADFNGDGYQDLLAGGNMHRIRPSLGGRHDASYGWYLKGKGNGTFEAVEKDKDGFTVGGEVREIKKIKTGPEDFIILVARNDAKLLLYRYE